MNAIHHRPAQKRANGRRNSSVKEALARIAEEYLGVKNLANSFDPNFDGPVVREFIAKHPPIKRKRV